jgi:hypothetical protein
MRLAWVTAGAGLVGVVVACSSSSKGAGGGAMTESEYASQFCDLIEPCCAQAGLSTSGTLCIAFASASAGAGTFDAASAETCISGLQAESGTAALCMNLGSDIPACSQVFTTAGGTTPPGGTCTEDTDCAKASGGSATCFDQLTLVDGGSVQSETCIQTTPGAAGEGPCIGTLLSSGASYDWGGTGAPPTMAYTCANASNLTCDVSTQKCVAIGDTGAMCSADPDCVDSDYCDFDTTPSVCAARFADGASCASDASACLVTSYCDSSSTTCKPLLPAGTACSGSQQCSSGECVNGSCGAANGLGLQLLCGTN